MEWDGEKNIGKLKELLDSDEDKLLIYHHDADGICSASLLLKFYPKMKFMPQEGPRFDSRLLREIESRGARIIIFADLPVDQSPEALLRLKRRARIAIIDHHIAERDMNRKGVLHINPKIEKDVYLPTSYMMYRILEKLGKKPAESKWISCIGVYADYGMKDCAPFLSSCEIGKDDMKKGAELVSSAMTVNGLKGAVDSVKFLVSSHDFTDFTRNPALKSWRSEVESEFEHIMGRFDGGKELYPEAGLVVYEINSRLNLTSAVSNRLSEMLPSLVVMIRKKSGDEWKVSLRCQSGEVNLGKIVKKCTKGIGSGGGHVRAAGGVVTDYKKFFERLKAELRK
jgi:single-stranded DNA-specific DHH superfamily exonuclease